MSAGIASSNEVGRHMTLHRCIKGSRALQSSDTTSLIKSFMCYCDPREVQASERGDEWREQGALPRVQCSGAFGVYKYINQQSHRDHDPDETSSDLMLAYCCTAEAVINFPGHAHCL